jgi:hypothetical protein
MHQMASALINILKTLNAPCLNQISYGKSSHLKFQAKNPIAGTSFDSKQNIELFFNMNMGADICLVNAGAHLDDTGDIYDIWETIQPWVNAYRVLCSTYSKRFCIKCECRQLLIPLLYG